VFRIITQVFPGETPQKENLPSTSNGTYIAEEIIDPPYS